MRVPHSCELPHPPRENLHFFSLFIPRLIESPINPFTLSRTFMRLFPAAFPSALFPSALFPVLVLAWHDGSAGRFSIIDKMTDKFHRTYQMRFLTFPSFRLGVSPPDLFPERVRRRGHPRQIVSQNQYLEICQRIPRGRFYRNGVCR